MYYEKFYFLFWWRCWKNKLNHRPNYKKYTGFVAWWSVVLECGVGVWCLECGVGVWCWSVVLECGVGGCLRPVHFLRQESQLVSCCHWLAFCSIETSERTLLSYSLSFVFSSILRLFKASVLMWLFPMTFWCILLQDDKFTSSSSRIPQFNSP